jgi:hypothetical protein
VLVLMLGIAVDGMLKKGRVDALELMGVIGVGRGRLCFLLFPLPVGLFFFFFFCVWHHDIS